MFGDIRAFLERFPAATTSEVVLNRHHFLGLQTPRGVRTPAVNATAQRAHSDVHAHLRLGAFSNPSLGGTMPDWFEQELCKHRRYIKRSSSPKFNWSV